VGVVSAARARAGAASARINVEGRRAIGPPEEREA
jgi:hypothetical protein